MQFKPRHAVVPVLSLAVLVLVAVVLGRPNDRAEGIRPVNRVLIALNAFLFLVTLVPHLAVQIVAFALQSAPVAFFTAFAISWAGGH